MGGTASSPAGQPASPAPPEPAVVVPDRGTAGAPTPPQTTSQQHVNPTQGLRRESPAPTPLRVTNTAGAARTPKEAASPIVPAAPHTTPAPVSTGSIVGAALQSGTISPSDVSFNTSLAMPGAPPATPAVAGMRQTCNELPSGTATPLNSPASPPQRTHPFAVVIPPTALSPSPPGTTPTNRDQLGSHHAPASSGSAAAPAPPQSNRWTTGDPPAAAPETMRAWVAHEPCDINDSDKFALEQAWPVPAPGRGQLRVRVVCGALNPVDFKRAAGFAPGLSFPAVVGCDGVGEVESVGPGGDALDFRPGDRVVFHNDVFKAHGTFAEYTVCDAVAVAHIPDALSFADAAAAPCAGYTAFLGLFDKCRVQPGQRVLVLGGAGGVGSYAVSLAKLCGSRVAATCSAASAEYVKGLGADVVVDYKTLSPLQQSEALKLAGFDAVDAVFDTVGACGDPQVLDYCAEHLLFGSHLCSVLPIDGASTGGPALSRFFMKQLSLDYVFTSGLAGSPILRSVGQSVMDLMADGVVVAEGTPRQKLPSHLSELIRFTQLRQGLLTLRDRGVRGKIVMSFTPPGVAKRPPTVATAP